MDLWIRSQDRESLTKISNIQYSFVNKCHFIGTYYDNLKILGKYKTKERALEVLDEIQNMIYINKLFNADINAFQKSLEIEGYTEQEIVKALRTISTYEMPKE